MLKMLMNWVAELYKTLDSSLRGTINCVILEECQSTMKSVKELFQLGEVPEGRPLLDIENARYLWCFALSQSRGMGRQQKEWVSSSRDGMYLSILACEPIYYQDLSGLSLAVGISIVSVLERYGINSGLKWPNDVLISGNKICGVLLETFIAKEDSSKCHVIVGVGLNINQESFPEGLNATSMARELGTPLNYVEVCVAVANQINLDFIKFRQEGFSAFIEQWRAKSIMNRALVRTREGDLIGYVNDIDEQGVLVIQGETEQVRIFNIDEGLKFEFVN